MVADENSGIGVELHRHAPLSLLFGLYGNHGRRRLLGGDAAEVLSCQLLDLNRVQVADKQRRAVVGRIVLPEIGLDLLPGHHLEIAHPAHHRPAIGAGLEGRRHEGVPEFALGVVLSQTALLHDDISLGVELSENGVLHPVCLEHHPEFQPVGGKGHYVGCEVIGGKGVEHPAAMLLVSIPEFILDHELLMLLLHLRELELEPLEVEIPGEVVDP